MPLPPVGGTLQKDIDPASWGLADNTALTFANSGLTPVIASPTLKINQFGALPAVRCLQSKSAFSIARPVQDDFTLYGVYAQLEGMGGGTQWYNSASLMDCEAVGIVNDFGVTIRADGKLCGGTGGDVSAIGTAVVGGFFGRHVICVKRTKVTGEFRVYVDGVLDLSVTNNTASLTANANMFFFAGTSFGAAGGILGRWLAYDAAHSDADRNSMEAYLATTYPDNLVGKEVATKLLGYAVLGTPVEDIVAAKLLGYAVLGPGAVAAGLTATKVVAYAVLEEVHVLPTQIF